MPTVGSVPQPVCQAGHIQQQRGHKFCDQCGQPVIERVPRLRCQNS